MSNQAGNDDAKQTSDPQGGISSSATTADQMGADAQQGADYGNTGQETTEDIEE